MSIKNFQAIYIISEGNFYCEFHLTINNKKEANEKYYSFF
jgi:hypothetical protein